MSDSPSPPMFDESSLRRQSPDLHIVRDTFHASNISTEQIETFVSGLTVVTNSVGAPGEISLRPSDPTLQELLESMDETEENDEK